MTTLTSLLPIDDRLCAELAASSYGNRDHPPSVKAKACWDIRGMHAEITIDKDNCYVTFRGTDGAGDWLHNLDVTFARPYPGASVFVHRGFLRAVDIVTEARGFIPQLKASAKDRRIVCVGHSLGGAMAEQFAFWLYRQDWTTDIRGHRDAPQIAIRKFGAPRTGCRQFAKVMAQVIPDNVGYAHICDAVTWQPSAGLSSTVSRSWWRYKHAGRIVRIYGFARPTQAHKMASYVRRV